MKMHPQKDQAVKSAGKWGAMLAIGMSVFMGTLDISIVNVSLPTLVGQLNTKFATIQWVVLAYALVITSSMPGVARLGDMWDKKRLFNAGLALFTLGSLLCGLSPNIGWLIAFRAVQGCGAVMTQALGVAIIVEVFPAAERGRSLGIIGSIVSVGIAMGPAIGGLIIGLMGWRWIFLVNVPVGFFALIAAWRFLPTSPAYQRNQTFDIPGSLLLFLTLGCFALGMTLGQTQGFGSATVRWMLFMPCLGLALFVILERRGSQPMVDLSLFKDKLFCLNLLMGFLTFVTLGTMLLIPFFLELVKGYPPQKLGFLMMMIPLAMGLTSPLSGALSDHFGPRGISLIGLLVTIGGCLSISTLHADVSVFGYLLRTAPLGIGLGLFQSPNNSAVMGAAPPERVGVVSGLLALSRTLGQTTGVPLMGAIFSASVSGAVSPAVLSDVTAAPPEALVTGLTRTFQIGALVMCASTVLSVLVIWLDRRRGKGSTQPQNR